MKYLPILFLLLLSLHTLSYAKYNWVKKNKLGAIGCILLSLASVVLPTLLIITR